VTSAPSIGASALKMFVARTLASVLAVLTGIVVAKVLGPDGKGVYSGVQVLLAVPIAVTGGAGAAITYLMTKERRAIGELLGPLSLVFAALLAACWFCVVVWSLFAGWTLAGIALVAVLPASIVLSWQQSFYVAVGELHRLNYQTIALGAATLVAVAGALLLGHFGTPGALGAWIACNYLLAAVVTIDILRRGGGAVRGVFRANLADLVHFGTHSAVNSSLGVLNYRVDSLVLAAMLGFASFGVYSIAVNVGELAFTLTRPIAAAVSRHLGILDRAEAAALTARTIRMTTALMFPIAVVAFVAGPWLVELVYGPKFAAAALPLRLLLPGIVAFATAGTFASFFMFQVGKPSIVTTVNVIMVVVQLLACIALVPRMGLAGAAVASSFTYLIGAAVNTAWFCRLTGHPASDLWIPNAGDLRTLRRPRAPEVRSRKRILLTGAAGSVAALIRKSLAERYDVRSTDMRPVKATYAGETFVRADLRKLSHLRRAMRGVDAVVHLGGLSKEGAFSEIAARNLAGTYNVFEAARLEGVSRVVFASTGHVTGFYPQAQTIDESVPPRPDTLYAASKLFGEALASLYADKHGVESLCIRIGHVSSVPEYPVDESIWLSPDDLLQLVEIGLNERDLGSKVVYGVSDNVRRWWSLERAAALGYEPRGRCDGYRGAVPRREGVAARVQGESFAARGYGRAAI
jgi:uronate dehydrogenase